MGSYRRFLSRGVILLFKLFFGKVFLVLVVGEGLVGVEGEEVWRWEKRFL